MRSVFSIAYGCGLHSLHLFLSLQPLQGSCRVLSVPFLLLRGAVEAASEESPRRVGMSPFWCLILTASSLLSATWQCESSGTKSDSAVLKTPPNIASEMQLHKA